MSPWPIAAATTLLDIVQELGHASIAVEMQSCGTGSSKAQAAARHMLHTGTCCIQEVKCENHWTMQHEQHIYIAYASVIMQHVGQRPCTGFMYLKVMTAACARCASRHALCRGPTGEES